MVLMRAPGSPLSSPDPGARTHHLAGLRGAIYESADGRSMLATLRLSPVRLVLVIMLMILSTVVVVERAQAVINGVQHALSIEHAAPVFDVAAIDHAHDHDHEGDAAVDGDHDPVAGDGAAGGADRDHAPGPHHQHAEGPQVAALTSPVTIQVTHSRSEAPVRLANSGSPRFRVIGFERPPKALDPRA